MSFKTQPKDNISDERLIVSVRKRPLLYDRTHPKFKNAWIRQHLWMLVGQEMQVDGDKCKRRWSVLLSRYRRSLERLEDSSGKGANKTNLDKYVKQLSFLNQFDSKTEAKRNVKRQQADVKEEVADRVEDMPLETTSPEEKRDPASSVDALSSEGPGEAREGAMPTPCSSRRVSSPHSVDAFLAGVAPTLKELTPVLLHRAKAEIFVVVHKYERKMIHRGQATRKK